MNPKVDSIDVKANGAGELFPRKSAFKGHANGLKTARNAGARFATLVSAQIIESEGGVGNGDRSGHREHLGGEVENNDRRFSI